ncbi:MAG: hypothetical protein FWF96_04235, partial [Kiritimatiellaeota bacterium]|nr:hypothetical protein [Kiritimatiellota bacterium]
MSWAQYTSPYNGLDAWAEGDTHYHDIVYLHTTDPAYTLRVDIGTTNLNDGLGDYFLLDAKITPEVEATWMWNLYLYADGGYETHATCLDDNGVFLAPGLFCNFKTLLLQGAFCRMDITEDGEGNPVETPYYVYFYMEIHRWHHTLELTLNHQTVPKDGSQKVLPESRGWLPYLGGGATLLWAEVFMCCELAFDDYAGGVLRIAPGNRRMTLCDVSGTPVKAVTMPLEQMDRPTSWWWPSGNSWWCGYSDYHFVKGVDYSEEEDDASLLISFESAKGSLTLDHTYTVASIHLCGDYTGDGEITPEDESHKAQNTP